MNNTKHIIMGEIVTAHGIKGGLKIKSCTQNVSDLFTFSPFWIQGKKFTCWHHFSSLGKGFFVAFLDHITTRSDALALRGCTISVLRSQLDDLEEGWVYYADLQGRPLYDASGMCLGTVAWVHDFGAGPVLEIGSTGRLFSLKECVDAHDDILRLTYTLPDSASST
jgi:16S rRNA processing protein RimM